MLILLTGSLAGLFHVLSGPDHLAAVTPLAIEGRRRGWLAGCTWGVGHASGVVTVAVAAVLLRDVLPPIEMLSAWSERVVGVVLIVLGFWALRRSAHIGVEAHTHGRVAHGHLLLRVGPPWLRHLGHTHASFCLGVLHGIAGSSHFLGVLPALALPGRADSLLYIAAFGVGTVVAMTSFAAAVGTTAAHGAPRTYRLMTTTAAVLAIVVGGVWLTGPA